ncbi:MAG: lipase maturation factor family protein [Opitutaceae bacterium]|nr:lipase maturation factor family protein [Opitutaceae bacterium]
MDHSSPDSPAVPPNTFAFGAWLFLRLLAAVHFIAFASAWKQIDGLVGPHGVQPAAEFFRAAHDQYGALAYLEWPSLCWFFGAGTFLHVLCAAGLALSLLLFAGIAPAFCLALLWAGYLSLCCAGQLFFNFQWDALLLETTLLALCLPAALCPLWRRPAPPRLACWLLWWLLFRLMFLSGVVKLASGDSTWTTLTALAFHYETQPLPTPIAWYACQLPLWFQQASCAVMFFIELVAPFALFGPRALRHGAAALMIAFMGAIALTGNYTFFNLLTVALCVTCLDDAWWSRFRPCRRLLAAGTLAGTRSPSLRPGYLLRTVAGGVVALTAIPALPYINVRLPWPEPVGQVLAAIAPFRSFNNYGLFAVMTATRPEIIIEGSNDGRDWRAYEFPWKPGDLARRPGWVAPHQPRLDWQMWFAALGSTKQNPWVANLCQRLLLNTPEVLALLATNPFPGQPPRLVRAVLYDYHFTDRATRARTGQCWRRTVLDYYAPPASLR